MLVLPEVKNRKNRFRSNQSKMNNMQIINNKCKVHLLSQSWNNLTCLNLSLQGIFPCRQNPKQSKLSWVIYYKIKWPVKLKILLSRKRRQDKFRKSRTKKLKDEMKLKMQERRKRRQCRSTKSQLKIKTQKDEMKWYYTYMMKMSKKLMNCWTMRETYLK